MQFAIILFLAIGGVLAQGPPGRPVILENAWPENPDSAIIGGSLAAPGEFPHQAYLVTSAFFGLRQSTCGGSLIQPSWVLTASHCIYQTDSTTVHLGGTNINQMSYKQRASRRKMHERYNPRTFENDVALLRLPTPAMGENIAIIALPPMDIGLLENETAIVSGYGLTSNGGQTSPDLLKVPVNIISNMECAEDFGNSIVNSTLCTFYTNAPASACQGDSGGPLTYNSTDGQVIVGLVSFGSTRGCDTAPVAFARISTFLQWINTNMV